ncbi:MAG: hypothetical protein ABR548_14240 [Actinomycetota bacterium]
MLFGVMAAALILPVSPARADGESSGLKYLGTMPYGTPDGVLRLLVDPALNLGMTLGSVGGAESNVLLFDLRTRKRISSTVVPFAPGSGAHALRGTVDASHHRILFAPDLADLNLADGCASGPREEIAVHVYSFVTRGWSTIPMPCVAAGPLSFDQFATRGLSYYAPKDRIYAIGAPAAEFIPRFLFAQQDRNGQTLLLRQIDPKTKTVDWEVDLRQAGCDLIDNNANQFGANSSDVGAFVQRFGDTVLSYCYGPPQNGFSGRQGFAIAIPIKDEKPLPLASGTTAGKGNVVIRSIPSLPEQLVPLVDPVGGRMLLVTAGPVNGNAVWVLDPSSERFLGIIASGVVKTLDDTASNYAAFDTDRGRLYYLSTAGLLVADVRQSPLPAGVSFDVGIRNSPPDGPFMGVAPKLRRIFVPDKSIHGYRVYEDDVPLPPPVEPERPDEGTADIPEVAGLTGHNFSAAASAYGMHILNTGGGPRIVDNRDPVCALQVDVVNQPRDQAGLPRCLAHALLSAGDREIFLAQTKGDVGSETGALASAAGGAFSSGDTADDNDLKRMGNCFVDAQQYGRRNDVWKGLPAEDRVMIDDAFRSACGALVDIMAAHDAPLAAARELDETTASLGAMLAARGVPQAAIDLMTSTVHAVASAWPTTGLRADLDPRQGSRGDDASGRPIRASQCEDFGDGATGDAQPAGIDGFPWSMISSSSVTCDAKQSIVTGIASAAGFAIRNTSEPVLSVAHASSSIKTELTTEGIKTTTSATADGVVIGAVSIGHIATQAVTIAHGQHLTTHATFSRIVSDVFGGGLNCALVGTDERDGCSWQVLVSTLNAQLGRLARVSDTFPETQATDHGYQAVVSKDAAERNSDHTMNDDDTHEWAGLKFVFYNDGQFGRSRFVLSLAGVHAEAHYGIFQLEEGGGVCIPCLLAGAGRGNQIVQIIQPGLVAGGPGRSIVRYIVLPARVVSDGVRLLVNNPREAGILFVLLSLLASPAYLAIRRRLFTRSLTVR